MRKKLFISFIGFFVFIGFEAVAQQIQPKGVFLNDKVKVGEELTYSLSVRYPLNFEVIFPDSSYKYQSFEYISRDYFETKSDSVSSFDSVIYHLRTFEIDTIQTLQLPVFVSSDDGDSVSIYSISDSITLVPTVTKVDKNTELRTNTELIKLSEQFNYPYLLIGVGIFVVLSLAVILLFGKQLRRAWKVYKMTKAHKKFTQIFFGYIRDVSSNNPRVTPEKVLAEWKQYMERLEKKPFTKYTTKEIINLYKDAKLRDILKTIDRSIYAEEGDKDLFRSFDYLLKFSVNRFRSQIRNVKKG